MSDYRQIGLAGERPWGEVVAEYPDGTAKLRIVSKLYREYSPEDQAAFGADAFGVPAPLEHLHSFSKGDEVVCKQDDRGLWCPVQNGGSVQ